ncbi:hypothetical protein BKA65DRAFT_485084 [Rhexocercosporidium sp. MPI-PUGE-AT-0058]|nr:hypothetical protein BKA65DRAFT_485084 [Rhexocercosporidium sp. MPI-PUGE-AT-0058]
MRKELCKHCGAQQGDDNLFLTTHNLENLTTSYRLTWKDPLPTPDEHPQPPLDSRPTFSSHAHLQEESRNPSQGETSLLFPLPLPLPTPTPVANRESILVAAIHSHNITSHDQLRVFLDDPVKTRELARKVLCWEAGDPRWELKARDLRQSGKEKKGKEKDGPAAGHVDDEEEYDGEGEGERDGEGPSMADKKQNRVVVRRIMLIAIEAWCVEKCVFKMKTAGWLKETLKELESPKELEGRRNELETPRKDIGIPRQDRDGGGRSRSGNAGESRARTRERLSGRETSVASGGVNPGWGWLWPGITMQTGPDYRSIAKPRSLFPPSPQLCQSLLVGDFPSNDNIQTEDGEEEEEHDDNDDERQEENTPPPCPGTAAPSSTVRTQRKRILHGRIRHAAHRTSFSHSSSDSNFDPSTDTRLEHIHAKTDSTPTATTTTTTMTLDDASVRAQAISAYLEEQIRRNARHIALQEARLLENQRDEYSRLEQQQQQQQKRYSGAEGVQDNATTSSSGTSILFDSAKIEEEHDDHDDQLLSLIDVGVGVDERIAAKYVQLDQLTARLDELDALQSTQEEQIRAGEALVARMVRYADRVQWYVEQYREGIKSHCEVGFGGGNGNGKGSGNGNRRQGLAAAAGGEFELEFEEEADGGRFGKRKTQMISSLGWRI